jgi:lipoprotein-releasing system ATP-binding protein
MLQAINIHKIYKTGASELHVLKGIDLKVEKGEFVSILGPSGAGKSTLLHIMGGLDEPSKGSMIFEGRDIYRLNGGQRSALRNAKIGFVFQFYHLLPEFSALENVAMPALIKRSQGHKVTRSQAKKLLKLVGLESRIDHRPGALSGGEQQRVAIARALINGPRLLLCDEPTGNLDSGTGQEIIELVHRLNKEEKTTVVIVTHEEGIAARADKVVNIKDGRLLR